METPDKGIFLPLLTLYNSTHQCFLPKVQASPGVWGIMSATCLLEREIMKVFVFKNPST
jgi:hypothetical protein